ncbi:MAG: CoA-binding protein [Chloroflexi bacterium]|nr:CoA-binding protein [Chloroflexota bacterium]
MIADLKAKLQRAFNPRTVAVVGDKKQSDYMWLRSMAHFQGKVYSVQLDPQEFPGIEALGVPNYKSLLDIPGEIDYVVVAVPRAVAPRVLQDCIKKNVGAVAFFTSGFAETSTQEGTTLQQTLAGMAVAAGLPLIGPNCMGVYVPSIGLRNSTEQAWGVSGPVAFLSQSGANLVALSQAAAAGGVHVSKSVSYGNAIVLDSTDFLEFLKDDPETQLIGAYIEGIKDGRRFFRLVREIAPKKPVIILKGGQTPDGARATASHTASLAESMAVWEALMRQCGVLRADTVEELVDTVKALVMVKPGTGDRVGLVSMAGGSSVTITDAFARAGLRVPELTAASYQKLGSFFNIIGGSYRNPLDAGTTFRSVELLMKMLETLRDDTYVDNVVLELAARRWERDAKMMEELLAALQAFKDSTSKPFLMVLSPPSSEDHHERYVQLRDRLVGLRIATYPTFQRAADTLKRVVDYYRFRREVGA